MILGTGLAHSWSPHLLNSTSIILFILLFPKSFILYIFSKPRKRNSIIWLIEVKSSAFFISFYGTIWQPKTVPGEWKGADGEDPGDQYLAGCYPRSAPVNLSSMMLLISASKTAKILILWWIKTSDGSQVSIAWFKIPWQAYLNLSSTMTYHLCTFPDMSSTFQDYVLCSLCLALLSFHIWQISTYQAKSDSNITFFVKTSQRKYTTSRDTFTLN